MSPKLRDVIWHIQIKNIGKRPTGLPAPPRTIMGHKIFYTSLHKDLTGQLIRREGYLSKVINVGLDPGSILINVGLGPGGTRLLGTKSAWPFAASRWLFIVPKTA